MVERAMAGAVHPVRHKCQRCAVQLQILGMSLGFRLAPALLAASARVAGARNLRSCIAPGQHLVSSQPKRRSTVAAMSAEEAAAQKAAASGAADSGAPTLFDKIISKQIPAQIIYEDEEALAFRDINPQGPVHFLVIPKHRNGLTQLSKATEEHKPLLGHLMWVAQKVAKQEGLDQGFRVVVNDGPNGCQSVYHLHLHIIGGRQLKWPPG